MTDDTRTVTRDQLAELVEAMPSVNEHGDVSRIEVMRIIERATAGRLTEPVSQVLGDVWHRLDWT